MVSLDTNGGLVTSPVGCHKVTYTGYDNCHNSSVCEFQVCRRQYSPVAVCTQYTVVSLTQDAQAWVKSNIV